MEATLNRAFASAYQGLWEFNTKTQEIWVDAAFGQLLGYGCEGEGSVYNAKEFWERHLHPEDKSCFEEEFAKHGTHGDGFECVSRLKGPQGNYVWIKSTGKWFQDAKSGILFLSGAVQDLSLVKAAEAELEKKAFELEEFASMASHDLQAPLRHIDYFADVLKRQLVELPSTQTAEEALSHIQTSSATMHHLIRDLLIYAEAGHVPRKLKTVRVQRVVEEVLETQREALNAAQATVKLHPLPEIQADPVHISQVFQNLTDNALKYRNREAPPHLEIGVEKQGSQHAFFVRDNGIGIPSDLQGKVFQAFKRVHASRQYSGTGMGLAIVKKIAETHGGSVWVDSEEGRGSTFWFAVPNREDKEL
ncbi:MAG: PAS domain-containing protein [Candidatus Eisenbacteria bacterium]|uniref:histidine kinase n=1 Tax=Eiseniibacteriota bacterium TaxID=2212470 RepID=A0A7Y2H3R6_UNCEI|nr:PAS domain-containing protein [Candidatus Eisenbacteria bacterium]